MDKMQYSALSREYRQYREIAKMNSKERIAISRKTSSSPEDKKWEASRKNEKEEYRILQERYRELEGKYRDMLETVKQRNAEHEKLKTEIKIYQKNHERDTQEIERLRCIIGLIKKRSVSIQVQEGELDTSGAARGSRLNKFDQSTEDEIKLKNSSEKINSRERLSPNSRVMRRKEEINWEALNKESSQGGLYIKSRIRYDTNTESSIISPKHSREVRESYAQSKKLTNSPYSRLRYIPGAAYK